MKRFGHIALKILLWIIASVIFLLLLVIILIQLPAIQNYAKNRAVSFLEDKIHTRVKIGHLSLGLPKLIVLDDVYFEDQQKDTLIAGNKLKVDINLFELLNHKVEVNEVHLEGITAKVYRRTDGAFNYGYIIKAFGGESKKAAKPADTAASMKFSLDKIILDNINLAYKDGIAGDDISILLGHFDTRIKDFDMDKMRFSIPKITLSGVHARIRQTTSPSTITNEKTADTALRPISLTLNLGTIDLSKIHVDFKSSQLATQIDLGKLLIKVDNIDLKNQKLALDDFELNDTKAAFTLAKPESVKNQVIKAIKKLDTLVASAKSSKAWSVSLTQVSLANDHIKFDNDAQRMLAKGVDFAHMDLRDLNADAENLSYNPNTISGRINSLTFNEKSGLSITKFHTTFLCGAKNSYLDDLLLETPHTILKNQVRINYPSMTALRARFGQLRVNAHLDGSRIAISDVLLLVPNLAKADGVKGLQHAIFTINGSVAGAVNNLHIENLEIGGLNMTHVKASANIKGLPDVKNAYLDLSIADFNTGLVDLQRIIPAKMIPQSFSIPFQLNLKGIFKGTMSDFTTRLTVRSSLGAVDLNAAVRRLNKKGFESYAANINTNQFDAGAMIKQPKTLGKVTLTASVIGTGTNFKTANLQYKANIASATVNGYTYQNLALSGGAAKGNVAINARIKDPNLNFTLDGKADISKKYPSIDAALLVYSINLQKLNFTRGEMRLHGKIAAHITTANPDYLNGKILLTELSIVQKDQRIKLDTVTLVSTANGDSSTLKLKAAMLQAHIGGKYQLTQIGPALADLAGKYFHSASAHTMGKLGPSYSPQQFVFDIHLAKTQTSSQLVPALNLAEPALISGHLNSQTGELVINGTVPRVVYGANAASNLKLAVTTANNALNYSLSADQIKASSSVNLLYTSLSGSAKQDKLSVKLTVRDEAKKERYRIAGTLRALPEEYQFSFAQNGLLLDYAAWTVDEQNAFFFGGKGIMARNFSITSASQVLSINSEMQTMDAPISLAFKNFKIETITKIARQDSTLAAGIINGEVRLTSLKKSPEFTSNVKVNDFSFRGDTLGNIDLKVNNQTTNTYAADMQITGKSNHVTLTGLYHTKPVSAIDLNLNIVSLNVKSIQGFSFGSIRNSSGTITGALKISGSPAAPVVRGEATFNKAGFHVAMLNSYFTIPNERITFNNDGVLFNDLTLVDSLGNKAIITGTLYTKTFTDYKFGLDINAANFRITNSTQQDNKLYYGKLFLDSHIKIRGQMNKPVVDADITLNDQTDLTIVLPQDDPGLEDRRGVVEVINPHAARADSIFQAKQLDALRKSSVSGLDVSANIHVKKAAKFTLVIDERNGDVVQLKGEAQLNGGIDPSGKTNLTGTYTVEQGSYNLSYATVKRKFLFKKGSTITWTGDPTTANMDLTAIYVANVPPIDLVSDQLPAGQNTVMYKQKLPFNVNLTLKNQLLRPDISFDISLPDSSYTVSQDVISNVNARLAQIRQDPNELNKQVLGVLILGHFIGDNPLQSQGGGSGLSGTIRNSVSSLLSDQLNKLAGNLIGGVQLSFELTSGADYATGVQQNRTDLNVGLSKQFLDDRVTVTVGNNFNLEGQNQPGQKTTDIAGNVSVNYKLTKDGRYLLRVYRRDEFVVVEGEVVETGVGFSLTYDYNRFRELFAKKTKQDKQLQKKYKEDQKNKQEQQKAADKAADVTVQPLTTPNKQLKRSSN